MLLKTLQIRLCIVFVKLLILLGKDKILEASPEIERTLISLKKLCTVAPCFAYGLIKMCNVKRFVFPHKSTHVDNRAIHDENKIYDPKTRSLHPQCSRNSCFINNINSLTNHQL